MAIMLLGLAVIPMVGMFDAGLRAAVLGGNYDRARALANERLEETKALPYGEAVSRYTPGSPVTETQGDFEYTVTTAYVAPDSAEASGLTSDTEARTMMRVEVEVEWDDGDRSYDTTGLVSRN